MKRKFSALRPQVSTAKVETGQSSSKCYYSVCFSKKSSKKHRSWESGALSKDERKLRLFDGDGRSKGSTFISSEITRRINNAIQSGEGDQYLISLNGLDVSIEAAITAKEFGRVINSEEPEKQDEKQKHKKQPFHHSSTSIISSSLPSKKRARKSGGFKSPRLVLGAKPLAHSQFNRAQSTLALPPLADPDSPEAIVLNQDRWERKEDKHRVIVPSLIARHLRDHQIQGVKFLYDCVINGVVLPDFENEEMMVQQSDSDEECKPKDSDTIVDDNDDDNDDDSSIPQRNAGNGCILADGMGSGKTLQCIALISTLLRCSPNGPSLPTIRQALIISPASLVSHWSREFRKWNRSLTQLQILDSSVHKKQRISRVNSFLNGRIKVLILGYEMFRNLIKKFQSKSIGILICDEGHSRLKNKNGNQTIQALNSLNVHRRILVSGTPIQNDLSELYSLCDFVNPGCLGTNFEHFRMKFSHCIEDSRDRGSSKSIRLKADRLSDELSSLLKCFILRRTGMVKRYLKDSTKHEFVIFHEQSELQWQIFDILTQNRKFRDDIQGHRNNSSICNQAGGSGLGVIMSLRQAANHPGLLREKWKSQFESIIKKSQSWERLIRDYYSSCNDSSNSLSSSSKSIEDECQWSVKFKVLKSIIDSVIQRDEKIVVSSYFTKVLDRVGILCDQNHIGYSRLDGATKQSDRDRIVREFNTNNSSKSSSTSSTSMTVCRVFLLSSMAGGVGLNLSGASTLVLMEPDWNPANDEQTMARIWRDGQLSNECRIYRLIAAHSIEEKIFQRQLRKLEIADAVVDRSHSRKQRQFSSKDLRDLFAFDRQCSEPCNTLAILEHAERTQWDSITNPGLIAPLLFGDDIDDQIQHFVRCVFVKKPDKESGDSDVGASSAASSSSSSSSLLSSSAAIQSDADESDEDTDGGDWGIPTTLDTVIVSEDEKLSEENKEESEEEDEVSSEGSFHLHWSDQD